MPHMPFMERFPNGKETHFREKIWAIKDLKLQGTYKPKRHTIRETEFWQKWVGRPVEPFYWEDKPYNSGHIVFDKLPIISWQKFEVAITPTGKRILVDGDQLGPVLIEELAINDGFDTVEEFFQWFKEDFSGYIYHFTATKY